jgi:hypothetical protein
VKCSAERAAFGDWKRLRKKRSVGIRLVGKMTGIVAGTGSAILSEQLLSKMHAIT